jgi:hypothetical protein
MAAYETTTKIFTGNVDATEVSTEAGSLAKTVNDYIEDLDSTTEAVISISTTAYGGTLNINTGRVFITVVHHRT